MIKKKNIYGTKELIHGSILLTSKNSGKQKWFLVCEIEDCRENRVNFYPEAFGKRNIRLTSDFNISQKSASLMPKVSSEGLIPYEGYRF
jgi:hypothetical protein